MSYINNLRADLIEVIGELKLFYFYKKMRGIEPTKKNLNEALKDINEYNFYTVDFSKPSDDLFRNLNDIHFKTSEDKREERRLIKNIVKKRNIFNKANSLKENNIIKYLFY